MVTSNFPRIYWAVWPRQRASRAAPFVLFGIAVTTISIGRDRGTNPHAMAKPNEVACSSPPPERKYRRFSLRYPVRLKVHSPDLMVEFEAVSRNISIGGLLLETSSLIPQHASVSFVVTAEGRDLGRPIQFAGEGKVVRVVPKASEEMFAIAVECAQPITQLDRFEVTGS